MENGTTTPQQRLTGRLAPSPTGALHVGNVRTFMIAWLRVRSRGGRVILRVEDLDHPRDKPGAAAQAVDTLRWLGFDWDKEYVQSERREIYREAIGALVAKGLAYPCVCSRRDVEAAQSAPHDGEQLRYPGTCRDRFASWNEAFAAKGATPCWRFRTPQESRVEFHDAFAGTFRQDVWKSLGDFPLARDADGAGYTMAVVVDDAAMGVTEVVRGDDLLAATPAQILLQQALGLPTPEYCHVPLVVGHDGRRLAKRHGDTRIDSYRRAGIKPEEIVGRIAATCGWAKDGERISLRDLLPRFDMSNFPHTPVTLGNWWDRRESNPEPTV